MNNNPWDDPTAVAWARHVIDDMAPAMADSSVIVSLVPDDRVGDVKFWVELGASVMMNKPIIAVVFNDADIPPKLRLVADEIVMLPEGVDAASSAALAEAIGRVVGDDDHR